MECGDLSPLLTARPVAPLASGDGTVVANKPPSAGGAGEDAIAFRAAFSQSDARFRAGGPTGRPDKSGESSPHSKTSPPPPPVGCRPLTRRRLPLMECGDLSPLSTARPVAPPAMTTTL
jgi:hypothetical protein